MPELKEEKRLKLNSLLLQADACFDWISVQKIDFVTKLAHKRMPGGFWGDGHAHNAVNHPEHSATRIYLTFDDGPSPETTPYLLELLAEENMKASFFLIGKEIEKHPDLVRKIAEGGHSIGNHSYSHQFMPGLKVQQIEQEIEKTNKLVEEVCGQRPKNFRPPFGFMDKKTAAVLRDLSMHPVYWSQAPEDWCLPGAKAVVRRVLMRLTPGALIVLHEGKQLKEQTLMAAKEIIYRCKSSELTLSKVELRA